MAKPEMTEQEWSHFFDIDDMEKEKSTKITIEASDEECQDMSRRLNVVAIKSAKADLVLDYAGGSHTIHVTGGFTTLVTLECSVTAEQFDMTLKEPVEGWFTDKQTAVSFAAAKREREVTKSRGEVEIVDEKDDPEEIVNGLIDLGELVTQHISLAIPPYPRKKGAKYEFGDENVKIDDKSPLRKNPFEALKDWKENR